MKRNIVLNIVFILIFILFLVLSLTIDFFFFIPVICFLPLSFTTIKKDKKLHEAKATQTLSYTELENLAVRYCQRCGGKIIEPIAVYCYHCGEKLNKK